MDKFCILLVEDNPGDIRLIQEYLVGPKKHGAETMDLLVAENLRSAKEFMLKNEIDLILLDLNLPDSAGINTLNQVWIENPEIPIVILTGSDDEELAFEAVRKGAQDYLSKGDLSAQLLTRTIRYSIERKRVEKQLRFLATHDTLTGLPNRSLFYDRLKHATLLCLRHKRGNVDKPGVAVMVLDVDDFKFINDEYGHDVGDNVLKVIAGRLTSCIRNSDTASRIGGDEFTIVLEGIETKEDCQRVTQKILESIQIPIIIGDQHITTSVSIGISIYPSDGEDVDTLIKKADIAMYDVKKNHPGYKFYSDIK